MMSSAVPHKYPLLAAEIFVCLFMIYIKPLQLKDKIEVIMLIAAGMSVKTAGVEKAFEKNIASCLSVT